MAAQTVKLIESDRGCLEWQGCITPSGYGKCIRRIKGIKYFVAHRYFWALEHGPIPDGQRVLHRCDNPLCCNVAHLFLGTDKDNHLDKIAKGRVPSGYTFTRHLTPHDALAMREAHRDGESIHSLSRRYGVNRSTVRARVKDTP